MIYIYINLYVNKKNKLSKNNFLTYPDYFEISIVNMGELKVIENNTNDFPY